MNLNDFLLILTLKHSFGSVYHLAYFSTVFWYMIIVFLFLTPKLKSERLELWVQDTLRFYFILYFFLFFLSQDISPTFNYTCRHEFIACYSQGSRPKLSRWGLFCTDQRAYIRKKHPAQRIRTNQSELVNTVCRSLQLLYAVILILCIY